MDKRILLLFVLNFYWAHSLPSDFDRLMKRAEKFCGTQLTNVLSLVCNGNYFTNSKRSYNDILSYGDYADNSDDKADRDEVPVFPFLRKEYVKSILPHRFRKRDGVVNECCYKACSRDHMLLYCGV